MLKLCHNALVSYCSLLIRRNNRNGTISILYLYLIMMIILGLIVFPQMVDLGIYSHRIQIVRSALKASIHAAVQEIDTVSEVGLKGVSQGFDEQSGVLQMKQVRFHEERSVRTLYSMFSASTGIREENIAEYLTIIMIHPLETGFEYIVKRGSSRFSGKINSPGEIEGVVNHHLAFGEADRANVIFVNGNVRTNEFTNRPYLLAIIKDFQIDGLHSKRNYTFIGFKAGRVNRRNE